MHFAVDIYAARSIEEVLDLAGIAPAQVDAVPTTLAADIVLGCSVLLDSRYFANLLRRQSAN